MLKKFLKNRLLGHLGRIAHRLGHTLTPSSDPRHRPRMGCAFVAMKRRGDTFATAVDLGASDGRWSASLMRHYPDARYLLIEAQPVHHPALGEFCRSRPNTSFVAAAAGAAAGKIYFETSSPMGGQASLTPFPEPYNLVVPVVSVDDEIRARALPGPYLLKFDTHGFEVPILQGAAETLRQTSVIIMECYNYRIAPECLLFHEMCAHLATFGFRCVDLMEPLHRPFDDTLWQMDLVFIRDDHPVFSTTQYT